MYIILYTLFQFTGVQGFILKFLVEVAQYYKWIWFSYLDMNINEMTKQDYLWYTFLFKNHILWIDWGTFMCDTARFNHGMFGWLYGIIDPDWLIWWSDEAKERSAERKIARQEE